MLMEHVTSQKLIDARITARLSLQEIEVKSAGNTGSDLISVLDSSGKHLMNDT